MNNTSTKEAVIFGFLTSYVTDFIMNRPVDWLPNHSSGMASGIFLTSVLVYFLFSEKFIQYKCNSN